VPDRQVSEGRGWQRRRRRSRPRGDLLSSSARQAAETAEEAAIQPTAPDSVHHDFNRLRRSSLRGHRQLDKRSSKFIHVGTLPLYRATSRRFRLPLRGRRSARARLSARLRSPVRNLAVTIALDRQPPRDVHPGRDPVGPGDAVITVCNRACPVHEAHDEHGAEGLAYDRLNHVAMRTWIVDVQRRQLARAQNVVSPHLYELGGA
jgi:hypothetical protein